MTEPELLATFTRILRDLLDDDAITLTLSTVRTSVPNWDSFQYVTFIAAVEMELGIKFRVADVEAFANVGDIVAETQRLLRKRAAG
jgi:acyl carrier protein